MFAADRMIAIVPFPVVIGGGGAGHRPTTATTTVAPSSSQRPNNNINNNDQQTTSSSSSPQQQPLPTSVIAKFCVPLSPNIPSKYVDKSVLLEKFGSVVQELQLSSACRSTCQSHVLTYANVHVKRICRLLDFILSFGLKRSSTSYWPLAKELSSKGQIALILQLWKPKSNRSSALSWLYQSLNDGLMEFEMQNFSRNISSVRKFYTKSAYVCEVEVLETLAIFLRGLENVTFRLFSVDQARGMDFTDTSVLDIITECCAEHERVLSSSTTSKSAIPNGSSSSPALLKVSSSPSRKAILQQQQQQRRHRGFSSSSSCDIAAAGAPAEPSFETPVADFSECPHVLGFTTEFLQEQLLEDTDLSADAMDFNYPPLHLGGIRASNAFVRKKKPNNTNNNKLQHSCSTISPAKATSSSAIVAATPAVRKIVPAAADHRQSSSSAIVDNRAAADLLGSSFGSGSFDASATAVQRRSTRRENSQSASMIAADPDTMLNAILARQKVDIGGICSPPLTMCSTPIGGGLVTPSIGFTTNIIIKHDDGLVEPFYDNDKNKDAAHSEEIFRLPYSGGIVIGHKNAGSTAGSSQNLREKGIHLLRSPTGSSLPDRLPSSSTNKAISVAANNNNNVIITAKENDPGATSSDFEEKIARSLRVVSDLVAGYSDSISEHSFDNTSAAGGGIGGGKEVTAVVEHPAKVVGGLLGTEPVDGEIMMESREIVDLSVYTFTNDGEQFLKMYLVYVNHQHGNSSARYLLLTSYAVYVLNRSTPPPAQCRTTTINYSNGEEKDGTVVNTTPPTCDHAAAPSSSKYVTEVVVPYKVIDFISLGACGQLFYVYTLLKKHPVAAVCTCQESLTDAIMSKIESQIHRLSSPSRAVSCLVTNATPQNVALKKWLCGELGKEDAEVARYSLVHWNPNAAKLMIDDQDEQSYSNNNEENKETGKSKAPVSSSGAAGPGRSGYLYVREYYPISWIWKKSEWKQAYFMLKGKKLYQFEDSTCKVGQRVFDLKEEVSGCRQTQTEDYPYCMEMLLNKEENVQIHLACQTKHELQQWLYAFVASFSQADATEVGCECVSCCAVIVAKYLILGQESSNLGFTRTLAVVRLNEITKCYRCDRHFSIIMEFSSRTEYTHQRWLLSFRNELEMDNFIKAAFHQQVVSDAPNCELLSSCDNDTAVCAESSRHWTISTTAAGR